MMRVSPLAAAILLLPTGALCDGEPRTYIRCDRPITCSVSYGTELVVLELHADEECEVEVWTGFEPQWALLNGERASEGWSRGEQGIVLVHATPGALMWEFGRGRWPVRGSGPPIPVKLDGKRREMMRTTFWARRMEARGDINAPLGVYQVTLVPAYPIPHTKPAPKLRIGSVDVDEWKNVIAKTGRQALRAESDVVISGKVGLQLRWRSDFTRSPVREILLETVTQATELEPVEAPDLTADGVIVIEAENFAREGGGGPVQISQGEHADQHGGASVYSFGPGESHWLEWRFEAPADGEYALYARTATQEEFSLRALTVDRKTPFPAAALLKFPGTGGWAREDPNQWVWTIVAGADDRPPLKLDAGEHRLRLTTQGEPHLNVDVMALVPAE